MSVPRLLAAVVLTAGVLIVAGPVAPAAAHTPRAEVENGAILTPNCGSGDGEQMARVPGGTGTVMFFPHFACAVRYAGNDLRYHPATIHYTMTGFTGTACGHFLWGGAITGESAEVCAAPDTAVTAAVTVEQRYRGEYTLYWVPDTRYVNAYADYVTNTLSDGRVEAEWGTLESAGCSMSKIWDGTDMVVYHPQSGCAQTFTQEGRYVLGAISYYTTTAACGFFTATGAITGQTATTCAGANERVVAAFDSANRGTGSYTLTWRTASGSPTNTVARVDQHTRTRVHTVEAETGTFLSSSSCVAPYVDGDVAVYTGMGCRQVFSSVADRVVDSITVDAHEATCGWFSLVGAVDGDSDEVCLTPGVTTSIPVHSGSDGAGPFTMSWFSLETPDVDVHVDSYTTVPSRVEAETGTVVNRTCGGDTTSGPVADGMFFAGNGCAATFTSAGGVHVVSARLRLSGLPGTVCGHLSFSGAITGRTDTKCADLWYGTDTYTDVPATTTGAATGGSYTVTWVTETGTLPTTDVTVDALTLSS